MPGLSILEFVRSHIVEGRPGLAEGGYTLPDEERSHRGSGLRWAAGALDGVTTHHMGPGENEETVRNTVELILNYSRQPTAMNMTALYEHVTSAPVVAVIDPVIHAVLNAREVDHRRLYELAHLFATGAPDREPVKFGIALLGLFRQPADIDLFHTLGRHDEFTLFCAVALANSSEDPEEAMWTLARNVTGWGRIQVVERLARTENPAIKRWLLREGFRNSVMYEYLAATCARAGGLRAALGGDDVDRELLTAAGEIIQALLAAGPVDRIDDYEDARAVLETYLDHMKKSAETVQDFVHVTAVKGFTDDDDSQWEDRYEAGWTAGSRYRLRSACESILNRPEWIRKIEVGLSSADDVEFARAAEAASALNLDAWDSHWRRLQHNPSDPARWHYVMFQCNERRIGTVLEFGERAIDLSRIETGPGDELGFGRGFEPHNCLIAVLQHLSAFPGRGTRLIEAGLRSPVVRSRNMAVNALAAWSRADWPPGLAQSLERAAFCEPNENVRDRMQRALSGESLSS